MLQPISGTTYMYMRYYVANATYDRFGWKDHFHADCFVYKV